MPESIDWLPDGTPFSPRFQDRYHSDINHGLDQARGVFLRGCALPDAWAHQPQWRILETGFGLGLNFLVTWEGWKADPARPQILHFVSCEAWPVNADDLLRCAPKELEPLARQLAAQFWGLLPGVHRLSFEAGRVLLTLYVGDAQTMLRQQTPQVDSVYLDGFSPAQNPEIWNLYTLKAIARCCHRGTRLATWTIARALRDDLAQCGFDVAKAPGVPPKRDNLVATYNPKWEPRAVREMLPDVSVPQAGTALIIGAGLAGSACAASLAKRGWQVSVLDAKGPAAGASGLPAGVFAPHVSPDDSLLSRLSRAGVRATLNTLAAMPCTEDWNETGVLEHRVDGTQGIPAEWRAADHAGADWSRVATAEQCERNAVPGDAVACWHLRAGWVKPPKLVQHQLSHENIRVLGDAQVARLHRQDDAWQAMDAQGELLAQADMVVITAGFGSAALLDGRWSLQALRGQISWGLHADAPPDTAWPAQPVNGNGNLVPCAPLAEGPGWVLGSTFERDQTEMPPSTTDVAEAHTTNFDKLVELAPALAPALQTAFQAAIQSAENNGGAVRNWGAVRCASSDRLPIVGPVDTATLPGLWVSTAMGARGLTLSVLCGELLAARLSGEPLPIDTRLAQSLASERMG